MNLRIWLKDKGLTQSEVAYRCGVDLTVFNRFVKGWRDLPKKHVERVAKHLGIPQDQLLAREIPHEEDQCERSFG